MSIILYRFSDGTAIFELPGLKQATLHKVTVQEVGHCFPEFSRWNRECRYDDCHHHEEPECGIKRGMEEGFISKERCESYLRIVGNL